MQYYQQTVLFRDDAIHTNQPPPKTPSTPQIPNRSSALLEEPRFSTLVFLPWHRHRHRYGSLEHLDTRNALTLMLNGVSITHRENHTAFPISANEFRLFGHLVLGEMAPIREIIISTL
jgi:hypothetical protein